MINQSTHPNAHGPELRCRRDRRLRLRLMPVTQTAVILSLWLVTTFLSVEAAVVNLPGVEFNAASGQQAHASSYYNFRPNAIHDTIYTPGNAIDGFMDESSWWSSGDELATEKVFWQLNMSSTPPRLLRIVIRWHGFLTPSTYKVRASYLGENFLTIAVVENKPIEYDRVDVIKGLDKVDARFKFLRVVIDVPNVCKDAYSCAVDGTAAALGTTNERVIYGIREFELWATGSKNAGSPHSQLLPCTGSTWMVHALLVAMAASCGI